MPEDKNEPTAKASAKGGSETKSDTTIDLGNIVENAFFLGLGAMEVTREQVTKFTGDLVDRGKMSKSDAKKVADDMSEMAKKQQDNVRKIVETESERAIKSTGVATKSDVDALKAEIAELKDLLAKQTAAEK